MLLRAAGRERDIGHINNRVSFCWYFTYGTVGIFFSFFDKTIVL